MRLWLILALPILSAAAATCESPFTATVTPGTRLRLDIRPGNIDVRGADGDGLRVTCSFKDGTSPGAITVSFQNGELRVSGGPTGGNSDATIRIDLPRRSDLYVRSSAGNLTIRDVTGDKDVELRAGNIDIYAARSEYRSAALSATAGNVEAPSLGIQGSGLFRSKKKSGLPGQYHLKAHVTAGNVTVH